MVRWADLVKVELRISGRVATRAIITIIVVLTLLSVAGQLCRYELDHGRVRWWVALFDLNREQNVSTYYQGASILVAAILLIITSAAKWRSRDSLRVWWAGLSGIMLVLSVDEMCSMHEQLMLLVTRMGLHPSGIFRLSWVIPALMIVAALGAFYVRFLFGLPPRTARRFLAAGIIYIAGAVGMEMVGGGIYDVIGDNTLLFQLVSNVEEVMEMAGMGIFIVSLIDYMSEHVPRVVLQFRPSAPVQSPAMNEQILRRSDAA